MGMITDYFKVKEAGSTVRREMLGGATTFATMSYIIFVQPTVLSMAGMDFGSVLLATCVSSAVACLLMGVLANYPIALAPGMGLNAFFAYTLVIGQGVPWPVALGMVFWAGVLFVGVLQHVGVVQPGAADDAYGPHGLQLDEVMMLVIINNLNFIR